MTNTTVKICGLQSVDTMRAMKVLHVDQIGFVFAKSKRQVSPEHAHQLLQSLERKEGEGPLAVGVFVNPTKEELIQVLKEVALDVIQLHGTETVALCNWIRDVLQLKVYKVFSISKVEESAGSNQQTLLDAYATSIDALLLDTYDPIVGGGTGETFAWERISAYQQWAKSRGIPLLIAGGLNQDNVAELIKKYKPDGVDVSSGVETNGVKDRIKMTQFIERVRSL